MPYKEEAPHVGQDYKGHQENKYADVENVCQNENGVNPQSELSDRVSFFDSTKNTIHVKTTTWQEAIGEIQNGTYKDSIERARKVKQDKGKEAYREYKKNSLPAVTFSGMFPKRGNQSIAQPTGIITADIDHVDNIYELFNILKQDPYTAFTFISPGGDGIKCGVRAEGITCDEEHKRLYNAIENYFAYIYRIAIDKSCKDISRLTFLSYDPDAYINNNAELFDIDAWLPNKSKASNMDKACPDFDVSSASASAKEKYARKALESQCKKIRDSQPTHQHRTRLNCSNLMGGYLEYIDENLVYKELEKAVRESGAQDMKASMRTVRDGLNWGKTKPITIPDKAHPGGNQNQTEENTHKARQKNAWHLVTNIAPRIPYPWETFPAPLKDSFNQLAHSCATDPEPLGGTAIALMAAAVGRTVSVSPKAGWNEPLIFWFIDIRESGSGKTPAMWWLAQTTKDLQSQAQVEAEQKEKEWENLPSKDKKNTPKPQPPRGYFCTDLTLEGLRSEMKNHPTGGVAILLSEASTLINSQNQYKNKGSDRESYLALHDGHDARVVRANKTVLISGARPQITGGIQPEIFKKVFGGDEGQYLVDGTVYRCLFYYLPFLHRELTFEGWNDEDREPWERTLRRAFEWADKQSEEERAHKLILSTDAQNIFLEWRNNIDRQKDNVPSEIKGFLPKTYGYALRFAGVMECLHSFSQGYEPKVTIGAEGMERGIKLAMYHLGQAVGAIKLLKGEEVKFDTTQAKILEALKNGPMASTEINKQVFNGHIKSDKLNEALDELKSKQEIKEETEQTSGRPKTLYSLSSQEITEKKGDEVEV